MIGIWLSLYRLPSWSSWSHRRAKLAARLFGAAEALLEPMGVRLYPGDLPEYERNLHFIRSQLDAATFDACWEEGRSMSFEQVVDSVLDLTIYQTSMSGEPYPG